jgi:tripartite-type tricarboxylate transporter receptor subunit TctC
MQKYLPGSTFIVKNVPGAGNIVGTNLLFASKADGLTIGTFNTGLIYAQMIGREGIRFDLTKFSWIGKASSDPRVITINAKSPIKSFADFMAVKEPQNFSTGGIGGSAYIETMMLTQALKLPIKMVSGYYGGDDYGAMRRGEVIGTISSRSTWEQFVSNGYARFIAQIGGTAKDVPQLRDHRWPARHSERPARCAARCLQEGFGGPRTASQSRQARSPGRPGLWR